MTTYTCQKRILFQIPWSINKETPYLKKVVYCPRNRLGSPGAHKFYELF